MAERNQPPQERDPVRGRFTGRLPVIKGRLTPDEVDSAAERTQPLGVVKQFREKGY